MIVVSDTTAITNLLMIGRAELLQGLFGQVLIPDAVVRELLVRHPSLPDFLQKAVVTNQAAVSALSPDFLDEGEAEAIVLAEEMSADYLLIDEHAGRTIARQRGIRIIGVLGVLGQAKRRGLISAVRPEIDALMSRARFWVSPQILAQVLRDFGEG